MIMDVGCVHAHTRPEKGASRQHRQHEVLRLHQKLRLPHLAQGTGHKVKHQGLLPPRELSTVNCQLSKTATENEAMCFFFYVSRHFFSPNLRGRAEKKQNVQRKKNALTQCSRPPDRQMTHPAHCVEHSHSFFFLNFLFPKDDKVEQLPVATVRKFDFFPAAFFAGKELMLLTLFNRSTSRTHSSSRPEIAR